MRNKSIFYKILLIGIFSACLEEEKISRSYPLVTTQEVSDITSSGATFSASIEYPDLSEIVEQGFVWGKDPALSLENSFFLRSTTSVENTFSHVINSTLEVKVKYYCRSFVKTQRATVYGNIISFVSLGSEGPLILGFTPLVGSPGDTIHISGKNFSFNKAVNAVSFGSINATVIPLTDSQLNAIVPDNIRELKSKIKVSILGNANESKDLFTLKSPIILDVAKREFSACDTVVIIGENLSSFGPKTIIKLNEDTAKTISISSNQIKFVFNKKLSAPSIIKITNGILQSTSSFQVSQLQPEFISVTPFYKAGDTIFIKGKNFPSCVKLSASIIDDTGSSWAYYRGIVVSQGSEMIGIKFSAPIPCVRSATARITGQGFEIETTNISMLPAEIISIIPNHGKANDEVVIKGKNLFAGDISFAGVNFLDLTSISETEYRGTVKEVTTMQNGFTDVFFTSCFNIFVQNGFRYDAPEISTFYPATITRLDQIITIEGKNFSLTGNQVFLDEIPIPSTTISDTKITINPNDIIRDPLYTYYFKGKILVNTMGGQTVGSTTDITIDYTSPWVARDPFPPGGRAAAVSFTINGKGYVGGGTSEPGHSIHETDFWEFDPSNGWTRKSDFPGDAGYSTNIGASANGKGYMGLSYGNSEWWEYDPATDLWNRKADFPGTSMYERFCFALNNKIYVSAVEPHSELWEFDPTANQWNMKSNIPGRINSTKPICFGFNSKGYLYGVDDTETPTEFVFDPAASSWTQSPSPDFSQAAWTVLVFQNEVVIFGSSLTSNYFYEITPGQSLNLKPLKYGGPPRFEPISFVIDNLGYIGLGTDGSSLNWDFWSFDPLLVD